jgi:hypothetical protein
MSIDAFEEPHQHFVQSDILHVEPWRALLVVDVPKLVGSILDHLRYPAGRGIQGKTTRTLKDSLNRCSKHCRNLDPMLIGWTLD